MPDPDRNDQTPAPPRATVRQKAGWVLCRLVVPLWVGTGATFKLVEGSPRLLPREMLEDRHELGVNLLWLLWVLIGIEYLAVAIMFFVRPLARGVAVAMLTVFCLVLIREIVAGNTQCGCMGVVSPPPWLMLLIDGTLLAGVLAFRPSRRPRATMPAIAPIGTPVTAPEEAR